jgi:hypothetical protein
MMTPAGVIPSFRLSVPSRLNVQPPNTAYNDSAVKIDGDVLSANIFKEQSRDPVHGVVSPSSTVALIHLALTFFSWQPHLFAGGVHSGGKFLFAMLAANEFMGINAITAEIKMRDIKLKILIYSII